MGWVQAHGNKQRAHLALKILFDPTTLRRIAFTVRHDFDAQTLKGRHQLFVVQRVLPAYDVVQEVLDTEVERVLDRCNR